MPVIRAGASYIFDRSFADSSRTVTWNEFNSNIGMSVPLSFANGSYSQGLNVAATFNNRNVNYTGASKSTFENKQFNFADLSFSFTNQTGEGTAKYLSQDSAVDIIAPSFYS